MNLTYLYEIQGGLKKHIELKHPLKDGEDRLERKFLALLVELFEAVNDWRGFKYWVVNNSSKETLGEEGIDGLHFVLEIGIELQERGLIENLPKKAIIHRRKDGDIIAQIKEVTQRVLELENLSALKKEITEFKYYCLLDAYLTLLAMWGFSEEQIKKMYLDKNSKNHERQKTNW